MSMGIVRRWKPAARAALGVRVPARPRARTETTAAAVVDAVVQRARKRERKVMVERNKEKDDGASRTPIPAQLGIDNTGHAPIPVQRGIDNTGFEHVL
ncbi:hypothetical protein D3C72_1702670 [compost metagenome]